MGPLVGPGPLAHTGRCGHWAPSSATLPEGAQPFTREGCLGRKTRIQFRTRRCIPVEEADGCSPWIDAASVPQPLPGSCAPVLPSCELHNAVPPAVNRAACRRWRLPTIPEQPRRRAHQWERRSSPMQIRLASACRMLPLHLHFGSGGRVGAEKATSSIVSIETWLAWMLQRGAPVRPGAPLTCSRKASVNVTR